MIASALETIACLIKRGTVSQTLISEAIHGMSHDKLIDLVSAIRVLKEKTINECKKDVERLRERGSTIHPQAMGVCASMAEEEIPAIAKAFDDCLRILELAIQGKNSKGGRR